MPKADTLTSSSVHSPVVWMNRNFLILFVSYAAATLGNKIYSLALPLILYTRTHSPVPMSTMRAIEFLPNLLLSMFIGVLVDRFRKKQWTQIMLISQLAILLFLYHFGHLQGLPVMVFYLCGFCLMTFDYGYQNGRMSMVKYAVPNSLMTTAMSHFSLASTVIGLLGPALSGFILMLSSPYNGLLLTCLLYAISCLVTLALCDNESFQQRSTSFWKDLRGGWRAFVANRSLVLISILVVFLNCSAGMVDSMLVFFGKDQLKLSNGMLGLALSAAGVGGVLGSMVVPYFRQRWSLSRLLGSTIIALSVSYFCLYMADNVVVMAVALFLEGVFSTAQNVCIWTYRQESVTAEFIGRVTGITGSIFKLGMPFAIFSTGFISQGFGTSTVFLCAALLNAIVFVFYCFSPLRKLH